MTLGEEFVPVLHELVKILLHIFKDEVELIVLPDHFAQLDYVGVAQFLQGLEFMGMDVSVSTFEKRQEKEQ